MYHQNINKDADLMFYLVFIIIIGYYGKYALKLKIYFKSRKEKSTKFFNTFQIISKFIILSDIFFSILFFNLLFVIIKLLK